MIKPNQKNKSLWKRHLNTQEITICIKNKKLRI